MKFSNHLNNVYHNALFLKKHNETTSNNCPIAEQP